MPKITKIHARQVFNSRGDPTIETEVSLDDGSKGSAIVPSGASKGTHEAHELRDTEDKKYLGKSVLKAIEKDANNAEGYYGLGGIYNYEKNFEEAERAFKAVLKIDPTHHNAWYSLGFTYELMGKKDEAEESYKKYRRLKGKIDSLIN